MRGEDGEREPPHRSTWVAVTSSPEIIDVEADPPVAIQGDSKSNRLFVGSPGTSGGQSPSVHSRLSHKLILFLHHVPQDGFVSESDEFPFSLEDGPCRYGLNYAFIFHGTALGCVGDRQGIRCELRYCGKSENDRKEKLDPTHICSICRQFSQVLLGDLACRQPGKHVLELASLEIRIARSENLPVLPQAVSQVLKLVDDPNVSSREVEKVIECDPAITAKILRVANSAYYGGNTVPTIGRAISFLGLNSIRSLVVSVAFQQLISNSSKTTNFNKIEYWRHCLAVATAARILGKIKLPIKAEELYCAGMMHDVGMLVMERFMAPDFDTSLARARAAMMPLHTVEELEIGFTHADVGGLLAEKWNLSKLVSHAIRYHHTPEEDGDYYETTSIVSAANVLAHQAGFTNNMPLNLYEIDAEVMEAIGLPTEQFDVIKNVIIEEVIKAQKALHIG